MPEMREFSATSRCPKCGGAVVSATYRAAGQGCMMMSSRVRCGDGKTDYRAEHICRHCRTCGYDWPEACLKDALGDGKAPDRSCLTCADWDTAHDEGACVGCFETLGTPHWRPKPDAKPGHSREGIVGELRITVHDMGAHLVLDNLSGDIAEQIVADHNAKPAAEPVEAKARYGMGITDSDTWAIIGPGHTTIAHLRTIEEASRVVSLLNGESTP